MPVCSGRGDAGDHCCYINGEVCQFLTYEDDVPRCSIWGEWDENWQEAPVGQWFARVYPGYTCADWPQNIPEVRGGLCCWEGIL